MDLIFIKIRQKRFIHAPLSKVQLQGSAGFTLLEVIVAIFILSVGIIGSYILIAQTISSTSYASNKLVASYLAQEGIEIVRNIRDTNWLERIEDFTHLWDEGLTSCGGLYDWTNGNGCRVSYTDTADKEVDLNIAYVGQKLYINTVSGFYSYSAPTPTKFKRKVVINPNGSGILKVYVYVEWEEKGKPYSTAAQEDLYNWQQD